MKPSTKPLRLLQWMIALKLLSLLLLPECASGRANFTFQLRGVYMGWLGHGNMGDELVMDVFGHVLVDSLRQQLLSARGAGTSPRVVLEYSSGGILQVDARGKPGRIYRPSIKYSSLDFMIVGGGSLLEAFQNTWALACQSAKRASLPTYLHATGTQSSKSGRNHTLALNCIRQPVFGGVRGPATTQLLDRLLTNWTQSGKPPIDGVTDAAAAAPAPQPVFNPRLPIIGDSGLLAGRFFPRHSADVVRAVDQHRSAAGVLCLSGMPVGMDPPRLLRSWGSQYTVVLMPVDHVTHVAYHDMLQEVYSLEPGLAKRVLLNNHYASYGVWLALLDRCDLLLTSRLHATIVAAAAQTPFRLFSESHRSKLKLADFVQQTFGEGLEAFRLDSNFTFSLEAMEALLVSEAPLWTRRYNASYEQRAIQNVYDAHIAASGALLQHLAPEGGYGRFVDARVEIQRFYDGAFVVLSFR